MARACSRGISSRSSACCSTGGTTRCDATGQVNEHRVAVCIRKAIPRMLKAIVVDVFHGDRSFTPHVEKAVRVYLAVHQVAIKLLAYIQAKEAAWRAAPNPAETSEGPALPSAALEQLAAIGADVCGGAAAHTAQRPLTRRERELAEAQRRAAERAQHQGYPKLPASRRLDGNLCYYCHRRFPRRMALFAHLRRVIDKERFIEGHHQTHFGLKIPGGPAALPAAAAPHRCGAEKCGKTFDSAAELWRHYQEMGVPGFEQSPPAAADGTSNDSDAKKDLLMREDMGPATGADAPNIPKDGDAAARDMTICSVCMDAPPNVVMVPCGHIYACEACGKKLDECALCRAEVTTVLRVFYS